MQHFPLCVGLHRHPLDFGVPPLGHLLLQGFVCFLGPHDFPLQELFLTKIYFKLINLLKCEYKIRYLIWFICICDIVYNLLYHKPTFLVLVWIPELPQSNEQDDQDDHEDSRQLTGVQEGFLLLLLPPPRLLPKIEPTEN